MRRSFPGSSADENRSNPSALGGQRGAAPRTSAPRRVLLGGLVLLTAGCSGGGQGGAPVSPRNAANQCLAEYDANKDGALDAKELEACPALLVALKRVDANKDGRLTADEIADRLSFFQKQGIQMDVSVEVTLDGRFLDGATVTLEPEKFMGPSVKSASTVTDEAGSGAFKTEGSDNVAVACGYYRVHVSKNAQGREVVPAKYNAQSVLGYEVSPDVDGRGSSSTLKLRLTSR
jgi:EF hand